MRNVGGLAAALCLLVAAPAFGAGDGGTAEEAKAMLERAIVDVKADEEAALAKFNSTQEGDYKKADLYVFCYESATGGDYRASDTLGTGYQEHQGCEREVAR